jgi:colanic acid biosynthesis protein WcaH
MIIEEILYNKIVEFLPILCVDALIINDDKILLLKRNLEPAKNEWWLPGGRVFKNEFLEEAVLRKVFEETGLIGKIVEQIGVSETIFFQKHTVNVSFYVLSNNKNVKLNSEHSDYRWFELNDLPIIDERIYNLVKKLKYEIKK